MHINKAINTLSAMAEEYDPDEYPNEAGAIQLGIEALEEIRRYRGIQSVSYPKMLPSETEE